MPVHQSARAVLINDAGRVLLFKSLTDPQDPAAGHVWGTPCGGVHDGEALAAAAVRKLHEEIGLMVTTESLGTPVARTSGYADLGWARGLFEDVFFLCRVTSYAIDISGQEDHERRHHAGHHWWSRQELAATRGTVHPLGLAELVTRLASGDVPVAPVRLPWHH
ncbi:NUDIX domain-containing protein [Streptomyces sp. DW26H14]|uniref:NUDIX domain-containing protein n=1 Tax=Streptomyces sp. DW26H14 TaxID=3435395 RepID=UPI00403D954C